MNARAIDSRSLLLVLSLTSACDVASGDSIEVRPGHSRPTLAHNWPHPRELQPGVSQFTPPDPATALVTLPNGVRAFIMDDAADNIVQVAFAVPLGALRERTDEAGASNIIADVIAQRVQAALPAEVLSRVTTDRSSSVLRVSIQTLPEDWRAALTALARAVQQPITAVTPTTGGAAGGGGGRGGGAGGGGGAVGELQRATTTSTEPAPARPDAVRTLAARNVTPRAVVFAIAGAITRADAESALRAVAGSWTAPAVAVDVPRRASALPRRAAANALITLEQPATQVSVALGHPLRAVAPADEPALAVLAEVLNIRLNIATREMRGLTNRASIDLPRTRLDAGMLLVRAATRAESAAPVLHFALDELLRIRAPAGAASADELAQVKGGLTLGSWQAALDGARAASATYALELVRWGSLDRLLGWPDAVHAVTAEQVGDVARRYIEPELLTAAVSGELALIGRSLHPRWPLTLDVLASRLRAR